MINKAEKSKLLIPLAKQFIKEGIVIIQDGEDLSNLSRNHVRRKLFSSILCSFALLCMYQLQYIYALCIYMQLCTVQQNMEFNHVDS